VDQEQEELAYSVEVDRELLATVDLGHPSMDQRLSLDNGNDVFAARNFRHDEAIVTTDSRLTTADANEWRQLDHNSRQACLRVTPPVNRTYPGRHPLGRNAEQQPCTHLRLVDKHISSPFPEPETRHAYRVLPIRHVPKVVIASLRQRSASMPVQQFQFPVHYERTAVIKAEILTVPLATRVDVFTWTQSPNTTAAPKIPTFINLVMARV
jgi:hypothetical protein